MDDWGAATQLVPGDPGSVGQLGGRLLDLAGGLFDAGQRIGLIEANSWTGSAATAFAGVRDVHAGAFLGAANSFGQAGVACAAYAKVLAQAQGRAGVAVRLHAEADAATARWLALRTVARTQAKEAAQTHGRQTSAPAGAVLTAPDPGEAGRAQGEAILAGCRQDVRAAAARAAGLIDSAAVVAPTGPAVHGWLYEHGGRQWLALQDGIGSAGLDAAKAGWESSFGGMAWGLAHGQRIDPHKLPDVLDPISQAQRLTAAARQSVDADEWRTDPWRAAGYASTNLMLAVASDGTGEGATAALTTTSRRLSVASRTMLTDDTGMVRLPGGDPKATGNAPLPAVDQTGESSTALPKDSSELRALRKQIATKIADGHGFKKHVIDQKEFPGVRTREQYSSLIERVMAKGRVRPLIRGRIAFLYDGIVVVINPLDPDGGTALRPRNAQRYFEKSLE